MCWMVLPSLFYTIVAISNGNQRSQKLVCKRLEDRSTDHQVNVAIWFVFFSFDFSNEALAKIVLQNYICGPSWDWSVLIGKSVDVHRNRNSRDLLSITSSPNEVKIELFKKWIRSITWCKSMNMIPSTWSHRLLQVCRCSSYKIVIRRTPTLSTSFRSQKKDCRHSVNVTCFRISLFA